MRTLTQVWVFFVGLTLFFLLAGFQLGGRKGLFAALILSLLFIYAVLHRGLILFKRHLQIQDWTGNDPYGFLQLLNSLKTEYGLGGIHLHYTTQPTPPLVWRNDPSDGHILISQDLVSHLATSERKLLAHFLLAHLSERTFLLPRLLSIFEQGFWGLNIIMSPLVSFIAVILRFPSRLLRADLKAMQKAQVSSFEMGYFIYRIHHFSFHKARSLKGGEFFSTITLRSQNFWRTHGLPSLQKRLINVMGFEP